MYGRLIQQTAPTVEVLTLTEVKEHLRITFSDDDTVLDRLLIAARKKLDGRDGILGRALATQTWDLKLDYFPPCIRVPLPPLQSIGSITYVDDEGNTQTLASSKYQVTGVGDMKPGYVVPAYNETWPTTRLIPEAVTVRFTAGYTTSGSTVDIPEDLRQAMLMIVGHWYEHREEFIVGTIRDFPDVDDILANHTVHYFA